MECVVSAKLGQVHWKEDQDGSIHIQTKDGSIKITLRHTANSEPVDRRSSGFVSNFANDGQKVTFCFAAFSSLVSSPLISIDSDQEEIENDENEDETEEEKIKAVYLILNAKTIKKLDKTIQKKGPRVEYQQTYFLSQQQFRILSCN